MAADRRHTCVLQCLDSMFVDKESKEMVAEVTWRVIDLVCVSRVWRQRPAEFDQTFASALQ